MSNNDKMEVPVPSWSKGVFADESDGEIEDLDIETPTHEYMESFNMSEMDVMYYEDLPSPCRGDNCEDVTPTPQMADEKLLPTDTATEPTTLFQDFPVRADMTQEEINSMSSKVSQRQPAEPETTAMTKMDAKMDFEMVAHEDSTQAISFVKN